MKNLLMKIRHFRQRCSAPVPRTDTRVYSFSQATADIFARFPNLKRIDEEQLEDLRFEYSLVSTCFEEAKSVERWLDSVLAQSLAPRELVICDAGSRDGTFELIRSWDQSHPEAPFELIYFSSDGANIAQGRNQAISRASSQFIALSDFGCHLEADWAAKLLYPFVEDQMIEASFGWYEPAPKSNFAKEVVSIISPDLSNLDPMTFLPSGRSFALKKELWSRVGGYPEYLSHAGEDSLFDYYLKCHLRRAAFVPDARVTWEPPAEKLKLIKSLYKYAQGDGEGGKLFGGVYLTLMSDFALGSGLLLLAFAIVQVWGGLAGQVFAWALLVFAGLVFARRLAAYAKHNSRRLKVPGGLSRFLAALAVPFAQVFGFVRGTLKRKSVERAKVAKCPAGHLLLISDAPLSVYKADDFRLVHVIQHLEQGWYVTYLYPRARLSIAGALSREHPHLESYDIEGFQLPVWWEKHGPILAESGQGLKFESFSQDQLAANLEAQLEHLASFAR